MTAPAPQCQPTTGSLSAEDREALDAVYIKHLKARTEELEAALREIRTIVHIPTKHTMFRKAGDHFASDFDRIRHIIAGIER